VDERSWSWRLKPDALTPEPACAPLEPWPPLSDLTEVPCVTITVELCR
jgi:hypothetical protein